jgi:hypothetical protein
MQMKIEKDNRFFKLTKAGIGDYKKRDPLEKARSPRQSYFAGQWDMNWAFANWIITIILLVGSFAIDLPYYPSNCSAKYLSQEMISRKSKQNNSAITTTSTPTRHHAGSVFVKAVGRAGDA